jgi:SAM-dependent methyltransferase
MVDNTPALIDFDNSVVSREGAIQGLVNPVRLDSTKSRRRRAVNFLVASRGPTSQYVRRFLDAVHRLSDRPVVLTIGGGTVGFGAAEIYDDRGIKLLGTDIYRTEITDLVADGHQLPIADKSVDGVWIQAVLEHVLEPDRVAQEIHRVLVDRGVVYAETPFMQQVHMGAYDFTRFTLSGHRWLFRGFEEISSGITRGPGTVMIWAIRYFVASVFGTYKAGTLAAMLFFWLRFFDRWAKPAHAADGASGVYFFGRRSDRVISPKQAIACYRGAL